MTASNRAIAIVRASTVVGSTIWTTAVVRASLLLGPPLGPAPVLGLPLGLGRRRQGYHICSPAVQERLASRCRVHPQQAHLLVGCTPVCQEGSLVGGVRLHEAGGGCARSVEVAVRGEPAMAPRLLHHLGVEVAVDRPWVSSEGALCSGRRQTVRHQTGG